MNQSCAAELCEYIYYHIQSKPIRSLLPYVCLDLFALQLRCARAYTESGLGMVKGLSSYIASDEVIKLLLH